MARGVGEAPERSPAEILRQVDYPVTPQELAAAAADAGAPPETINFLRLLPGPSYESPEAAMRDFAEAEARLGLGGREVGHRSDIGKETTEPSSDHPHHP